MNTIPGYITIREAAEKINVSHESIRKAIRKGKLKCRKVGLRTYLIGTKEFERYETQRQEKIRRRSKGDARKTQRA